MRTTTQESVRSKAARQSATRQSILDAAFAAFMENGYANTSTLEIASRAHVSKRELYAMVGNKEQVLIACIQERARRLQTPADLPEPRDRESLAAALIQFGMQLLKEVSHPNVIAVHRLAIAESSRAPDVARALESIGRQTARSALTQIIAKAQASGLIKGQPVKMAEHFAALLWGDLMIRLLLQLAEPPTAREISLRARQATDAFLRLYPDRKTEDAKS